MRIVHLVPFVALLIYGHAEADEKRVKNPTTPCCKLPIQLIKPADEKPTAELDSKLLEPHQVTLCDLYAGHPYDPFGRAVGRIGYVHRMATKACKADLKRYPKSYRIRYQNLRLAIIEDPMNKAAQMGLQELADRGYVIAGVTKLSVSKEPVEQNDKMLTQILESRPLDAGSYGRIAEDFIRGGSVSRISIAGLCGLLEKAAKAGDPESIRTLESAGYGGVCPGEIELYSELGSIEYLLLMNGDIRTLEFMRMPDNSDREMAIRKTLQEKLAKATNYSGPTAGAWTPKFVSEIDRLFAKHPYTLTDADLALR